MSLVTASSSALAAKLSLFFGALFLIHGVHMGYLQVWLDARGLSAVEIAIASSAPMMIRIVLTPLVAFVADRARIHREMIIGGATLALLLLAALNAAPGILAIMVLAILMQMALQTIMPLADTVTMTAVKEQGLDYGRIRLWGSVTFIVAGYIAGFAVSAYGADIVLFLSMSAAALTTAAALLLPRADAEAKAAKLTVADAVALVRDSRFMWFLLAVGAVQGSHAMLYVFGVLHWRAQHLSAGYIASIWAISVIAEIALFWGARWLVPFGAVKLILAGCAAGLVRWTAMAFDPAPWLLVPLQILHAGTFAATHLGAMHWIGANIPAATAGTTQALLSTSTAGVAMSILMLASGPLYANYAGGAYAAMSIACVIGGGAALLLARAERQA